MLAAFRLPARYVFALVQTAYLLNVLNYSSIDKRTKI